MRTIGALLFCGMLLLDPAQAKAPQPVSVDKQDSRLTRLRNFFTQYDCPVAHLSPTFIRAADRHGIDWRLLPAIAFIESTGGKEYRNNNILGWGNGSIRFRSIAEGIRTVAERLANSVYYRGKDLDDILTAYNPRPEYRRKVKAVMQEIDSAS